MPTSEHQPTKSVPKKRLGYNHPGCDHLDVVRPISRKRL